jgi:hypothetical protein
MKKFKKHQRPRREYRFDIAGNKKALKIWWDSTFKAPASHPGSSEQPFSKFLIFNWDERYFLFIWKITEMLS